MVSQNYFNEGFSDVFLINIKDKLDQLQKVIYELTKEYLVDHDNTIEILERLSLPFKTIPDDKLWSKIMNQVQKIGAT